MQSPVPRSRSVLIWAVLAVLALALFAGMSLLALVGRAPGTGLGPGTPAQTPAVSSDEPTADLSASGAEGTPVPPLPEGTAVPVEKPADATAAIGLWLSAVSAITALIGLASSLWLGWRKEGREVAQHVLELEKARLEIRKLQQELATATSNPDPPQPQREGEP